MDTTHTIFLALMMGVATVELFAIAWISFMGIIARGVILCRRDCTPLNAVLKISQYILRLVISGALLSTCFYLYSHRYQLGDSGLECMCYLLAATVSMCVLLKNIVHKIHQLFETDED